MERNNTGGLATLIITLFMSLIAIGIAFGFNALIVWAICKIVGWTFAWKWVILFTLIYAILKSLFSKK